jgi:hypothetical protein
MLLEVLRDLAKGSPVGTSPLPTEYHVFLSHSSLDDQLARAVAQFLEANGIPTFATPESIPMGKWEPQIERALQQSSNIWVLLTPNTLSESVWAHHEFGYFYGYRHGKGIDPEGQSCRFLYTEGTQLRGLYGQIQGVRIESLDDPLVIARVIAKEMGREFNEPQNPQEFVVSAPGRTALAPEGLDEMQIVQSGSSASPDYSYGICTVDVSCPRTIFNVSVVGWHEQVYVSPLKTLPQVGAGRKQQLSLRVQWAKGEQAPSELEDSYKRRFPLQRPRDPRESWAPLYVTFETQSGEAWAGVTYMRVELQVHGHPETHLLYGPNPYGWIKGLKT